MRSGQTPAPAAVGVAVTAPRTVTRAPGACEAAGNAATCPAVRASVTLNEFCPPAGTTTDGAENVRSVPSALPLKAEDSV